MNEILLEYYQGKNKDLLKCERILDTIVDTYIEEDPGRTKYTTRKITVSKNDPINRQLENELEKIFKAERINIYWMDGAVNANHLGQLAIMAPGYKSALEKGQKTGLTTHIMLNGDLITRAKLNSEEILAIILQQIGYSFYWRPIHAFFQTFSLILTLPFSAITLFLAKAISLGLINITQLAKEHIPAVYNAFTKVGAVITEINAAIAPIKLVVTLSQNLLRLAQNPTSVVDLVGGYGTVKGTDSFAAMYGYGPALASALRKTETLEGSIIGSATKGSDSAIVSVTTDLSMLIVDFMMCASLDPHPTHNQRAQSMLRKLKKDLMLNDYPPGVKKDLERQIRDMEKVSSIISTNSTESSIQIRQGWYDTLNTLTEGHTDIREIFSFYFDDYEF